MVGIAQIELSPSFANALNQFGGEEPITAWAVVQQLLKLHPEYGGGLAERVLASEEPEEGERRTAQEWLEALNDLFDAEAVGVLHGRLAIWGLAQLDGDLNAHLQGMGFLEVLQEEMRARGTAPEAVLREQPVGSGAMVVELPETAEALALEANRDVDSVLLLAAILYEGAVDGSVNAGLAVLEAMEGEESAAEATPPTPGVRVMEALGLAEHYGVSSMPSLPVTRGTPAAHTAEVEEVLARAVALGRQAGQRTTPHKRDLLAALLAPQAGSAAPDVQGYLRGLSQDVAALRRGLLAHVRAHPYGDDVDFWEQVLLQPDYLPPNAGYISDAVSVDAPDHLGIEAEVSNFAHLLMSRRVQPPLSLGLFGDWGSGKSFFMGKLRKQIEAIAGYYGQQEQGSGARSEWCSRVVQIDFNAWHFSDANLWASLVTRIYDALYAELSDDAPSDRETREKLKRKVQEAEGRLQDAEAQLENAKEMAGAAELTLQRAAQERAAEEESLRGLIDDVQQLLRGGGADGEDGERAAMRAQMRRRLNEAADSLGYPEAAKSYEALQALNGDLQTFSQRLAALGLHAIQSPWALLILLLAVVGLPLGVSVLVESTLLDGLVQEGGEPVVQAGSLLLGLAGWLKFQIGRGLKLIESVETGLHEVEKVRQERMANSPQVQRAQQGLLAAQAKEEAARSNLAYARGELYRLQSALEELRPETKLFRLIEERSSSGAYTQHLGIISLIRSDFESISDLLRDLDEEERDLQEEPPPIQRIILYIDDLDRCRPERVVEVLEAVHMLLAFPLFIVVVGVDPRWLRRSLSEHYAYTLGRTEDGEAESLMAGNRATPQQYLEKIFQIPFALRPVEQDGYESLVADLMKPLAGADGAVDAAEIAVGGSEASSELEGRSGAGQGNDVNGDVVGGDGATAAEGAAAVADTAGADTAGADAAVADTAGADAAGAGSAAGEGQDSTVGSGTGFTPLSAEQLTFTPWEEADIKRLWPMFRTPRTVKRFVNIYRLLRAGLHSQEAVARFAGSEEAPGVYQVPMLLLAVVTGYPDQAARFLTAVDGWLDGVQAEGDGAGQRWSELVAALKETGEASDGAWQWLAGCLEQVTREGHWQPFDAPTMRRWALRVSRYSFALDSSQAVYEEFRE